jgi:hypothetical protein
LHEEDVYNIKLLGDIATLLHNIELLVCTVCTVHYTWSKVKAISAAAYVADSGRDISAQTEVGATNQTQLRCCETVICILGPLS